MECRQWGAPACRKGPTCGLAASMPSVGRISAPSAAPDAAIAWHTCAFLLTAQSF